MKSSRRLVKRLPLLTPADFATSIKGRGAKVLGVRREFVGVVVREGEGTGEGDAFTTSFVMSTADDDRMGDTIEQDGWDTAAYAKNPVLLWAHDYSQAPVGRVGRSVVEDGNLKAKDVKFQDREVHEFGWAVGEMYRRGFLNAVSVGFQPSEWEPREDGKGLRFIKQSLLELSAVPVPANASALQEAKSAGLWLPGHVEWVERTLDTAAEDDTSPAAHFAARAYEATKAPMVQVAADVKAADEEDEEDETAATIRRLERGQRKLRGEVRALTKAIESMGERMAQLAGITPGRAAPEVEEEEEDKAPPTDTDEEPPTDDPDALLDEEEEPEEAPPADEEPTEEDEEKSFDADKFTNALLRSFN